MEKIRVGVIGATGMVGQNYIKLDALVKSRHSSENRNPDHL